MKILLGHKIGMTQLWNDKGKLVAATVVRAEPNKIIKVGEDTVVATAVAGSTNKPQRKLAEAVGSTRGVWVKTVRGIDGDSLDVTQFEIGDVVTVSGTTKGKGFSGTIKRHNFHRGPVSHGSDNVRRPGSIGAQRPQRVPKGQKMAGQMGNAAFTSRGNKVVGIDKEENLLIVSGAIPGPNKGRVIIKLQEKA